MLKRILLISLFLTLIITIRQLTLDPDVRVHTFEKSKSHEGFHTKGKATLYLGGASLYKTLYPLREGEGSFDIVSDTPLSYDDLQSSLYHGGIELTGIVWKMHWVVILLIYLVNLSIISVIVWLWTSPKLNKKLI